MTQPPGQQPPEQQPHPPEQPYPPGQQPYYGHQQWVTPPPPRTQAALRPIRTSRVFLGIGLVLLADLLAIGAPLGIAALLNDDNTTSAMVSLLLLLQALLFVGSVVAGTLFIVRWDKGIGIGIMIGWAVSALAMPVIGFGLCVAALNSLGTA